MLEIESQWNYAQPEQTRRLFIGALENLSLDKAPEAYLQLLTQIARTYSLQGEFQAAHDLLEQVKYHWAQATDVVQVRYFLEHGRTLNSANEKQQALEAFDTALRLAEAHGLDFYAIDAAHMLGIVAPVAEQIHWHEKAIALAEASSEARSKNWLGSLYNNLAWTYHDLKAYDKALELFEKNLQWHQQKQSKEGLVIAKWSVARVRRSLGQYTQALSEQEKIVEERKSLGLAEGGYAYEEIAENLLALNRPADAAPYFEKAHALLSSDPWLQKHEKARLVRLLELSQAA